MFRDSLEKPDIATHYAEMGDLLTLNPKIHRLGLTPRYFAASLMLVDILLKTVESS